ncbi:glutamate-5-semialdehyde dehydrogenase [Kaistia dalseonensis]|uniref:Gamma-glutamyl phosphate reductase n=1 Tax=Kaistia dalseonensis TaxID=410840 RepID=A0ABU0H5E7_9HYPH|nr:glutamate-5-semialdehyde dehydrogenase [Kaistia dalseonensis]MCX5494681.1 glutamate-5-semialdehyde dehydrogenase [Kaistia dalseonensis]MDQ0437262.1 glutamate-5-semialdehyde dehydrogenase [Kaistia dalseonensis]
MTAALATIKTDDVAAIMRDMGRRARAAARQMAMAPTEAKNNALMAMAAAIRAKVPAILAANAEDVAGMKSDNAAPSFLDRLTLTPARIEGMAAGVEAIAALPDPVGEVTSSWDRPNGLHMERVRTPLGVIGVIYESRPNVTADAGALCLKAGNVVILRGGSDSFRTSQVIHEALVEGLVAAGLPGDAIQIVPTRDRAAVGAMLKGLDGAIDVIVPRGGKSLVARVQEEARVPVFAHLEAIVHVYVDGSADLDMAKSLLVNGKMRRTGVCGATETLLIDRSAVESHLVPVVRALIAAGCAIRGDAEVCRRIPEATPALEADWSTEYLDAIISVKIVDGLDEAVAHIETYGSHHTDAIITEDAEAAARFLSEVDSAITVHNASTQFADGGEFGFGGEIGIATGRMHARGPVGLEQLTSFKYRVHGTGQTRP